MLSLPEQPKAAAVAMQEAPRLQAIADGTKLTLKLRTLHIRILFSNMIACIHECLSVLADMSQLQQLNCLQTM